MKKCVKCNEEKEFIYFGKDKQNKDGLCGLCKICIKNYKKEYFIKNKEKLTKSNKEYHFKNREKLNKIFVERKKNNPILKLKCNTRNLIGISIKRQGYSKNSKTFKILKCTFEEFKEHLEKQFTKGMTWENAGQWHLDHIYPVSLAINEEHLIQLNHYTNFQPLWAEDNLKKGNRI